VAIHHLAMLRYTGDDVARLVAICCAPGLLGLIVAAIAHHELAAFIFLTWVLTGCEIVLVMTFYECWKEDCGGAVRWVTRGWKGERCSAGDAEGERHKGEKEGGALVPPVANEEQVLDAVADEHEEA